MVENLTLESFKKKVFDFDQNKEWNFNGEYPVLIDFYADWCGPCKAVAPILDELSVEFREKIKIYKIDTQNEIELAGMFGIRSIPSLLFISMNSAPQMAAGAMGKDQLKQAFREILKVE